jgi:muramoyltetrapeptide carboxypeptidase
VARLVTKSLNKVTQDSIDLLKDFLFHGPNALSYHHISPLNKLAEATQTITAPIIGGNLHVMQASLGTFWQINAADKILFIEEINERAYRVDRVLAQLEQARIVGQARAILFGDMPDKGESDGRFLIKELLHEFAARCGLPVLQINNVGHTPVNHPLLLGYPAKLSMGNAYSLSFIR